MSKLTKLCTLIVCSSLYTSYSSIKLERWTKRREPTISPSNWNSDIVAAAQMSSYLGTFLSHVTESNSSCWSGNFGICPELHLALPDSSIGTPNIMIYRLSFKWSKKQTRAPFDLVHHPQWCHKLLYNFRSGVSFASVPTESAHLCTF